MKTTTRRKNHLVCIDPDGCVIDSMSVKHIRCFDPAFTEVWHLEERQGSILERWNEVNLYPPTRDVNQFKGLAPLLRGPPPVGPASDIQHFIAWTETMPELSSDTLRTICSSTETSHMFKKAPRWSLWINELIGQLPTSAPFSPIPQCLKTIRQEADIAVVSSANVEAIRAEWEQGGLLNDVSRIFSQSNGSKTQCIKKVLQMGYWPDHALMVRGAPEDYDAANQNRVWLCPILAGKKGSSWQQFANNYLTKLFYNGFSVELQLDLLNGMKRNLGIL